MIFVRLMGGLGNQMFQYAFGRAMSLKYNTDLVLDQSLLLDKSSLHEVVTHRDFDLDLFEDLKFRWATEEEIYLFNGKPLGSLYSKIRRRIVNWIKPKRLVIQRDNLILDEYFSVETNTCFIGRWQSYLFFENYKNEIVKDFNLIKPKLNGFDEVLQEINTTNSICLHVRRGDLISSPIYSKIIGALPLDYYTKAIEKISTLVPAGTFYVFSDDIEWCKKNIEVEGRMRYMDKHLAGKKAEGHLYLMMQCQHFIISNSTYAWWAAFLSRNEKKNIIYPSSWNNDESLSNPNMSPDDWISI